MKAIVTGAAGFIGSHVAEALVGQGWSVLGIDDLSGGFEGNLPKGIAFERVSVLEPLDELFKRFEPDAVYHLAAYAAEGLSHHIPLFNFRNNVEGTVNVLLAAYRAGARHLVFTSSIAVYGHPRQQRPFLETDACEPSDPYGIAKLACELQIRSFHKYYGRPAYTIFRPHNVYGPRQNISDPYRNVVGIFMRCALSGEPFPVFGDGSQTRSFSYITQVANAIASAPAITQAANQIFNVGADEPTSVKRLGELVAEAMGAKPAFKHLPERQEVKHAHAEHARLASTFGDRATSAWTLFEGLRHMATYVRSNPIPSSTPCPSAIEVADRLPPSWAAYRPAD